MSATRQLRRRLGILLGALDAWPDIRHLLVRRHYARHRRCRVAFGGVDVDFATDDFYSTAWFRPVFDTGVYEPGTLRVLLDRLPSHRCFADVGANLGYFTTIAAKAAPKIQVYAFEADRTLVPLIERNAAINRLTNVTAVGTLVGRGAGTGEVSSHAFSFLGRITGIPTQPFDVRISVPIVGLDDYFAQQPSLPDFLKIDVDGADMDVVSSMPKILAQDDVELLLEIHRHLLPAFGSSAEDVVRALKALGFRLYRVAEFRGGATAPLTEMTTPAEIRSPSGDMYFVTRRPLP